MPELVTVWETSRVGGRLSSGAFVGRGRELDRLDQTLAALTQTGVSTVLVGGDAGIGKSRLIEEFCQRARTRGGALVAIGVCTPTESGGLPFGPIVGALRDASRQLAAPDVEAMLGPARRLLGLVGPSAHGGEAGALTPGHPPPGGLGKTNLFEALLQSVGALAERSPVVLIFEDLQWADSASVEVIDFLTRNLVDRPVMLVATYRSDEVDRSRPWYRALTELGRHSRVSDLEIAGLDRAEMASMLAGILGSQPEWALVDAVQARSGGNPFFAEELAAARHATALPPSLRNVVMMRIERLSADARQLVALVAAAGGSIHHRMLSAAVRLDPDQLDAALSEPVELQVLVADPIGQCFRFRHALLREAVYDALLPGERSRLHRALAVALTAHPELGAAGPGHSTVELADHWWQAAEWSEAYAACLRAGEAAAALFAIPEACTYYERALTAGEHADADAKQSVGIDRVDLLMKAADAAYLTGEIQRSVDLVRDAMKGLDADSDPHRLAACYTMLGRNAWAGGELQVAFDAFQQAAAVLPADVPTVELAGILAEEARSLMLMAHYEAAETKCREALAVARAAKARVEESHVLITAGCCVAERGDVDGALALLRQGLAIADELGNADQLNRAWGNLGHVFMQGGRLEEAADLVFGGRSTNGELNWLQLHAAGQNAAEALIRLGRLEEAENLLSSMVGRGVGSCVFGPYAVRAITAIRRGRFDEAARSLAAAEELSSGVSTVQVSGQLRMLYAELALERNEPGAAIDEIERALTVAAGTDDSVYTVEMYALGVRALVDDFEDARARGRRLDPDKVQRQVAGFVEEVDAIVEARRVRGFACSPRLLALIAQCHAEASRLGAPDAEPWRDAAHRWDTAGEPHPALYCRWREAEALLSGRGDRRRATQCVQDGWRTATKLGAEIVQARLERLAERARIRLDADEAVDVPAATAVAEDLGLTAREVEVLAQLAKGRTDRQIAGELFISKKTASVHVSNLLRKLDAANRIEAGEIGQRAGLS